MSRDTLPSRMTVIGIVFLLAILAFEVFNFDTTRFALNHLLRNQSFNRTDGISWAAILAVAFCGIDFAGLIHIFTGATEKPYTPLYIWYLMGAWLLGATLNAIMTWYAVSLLLIDSPIVNGVMTQAQLLTIVPIFVSFLVWLTRIMFIATLAMMGSALVPFLHRQRVTQTVDPRPKPLRRPARIRPRSENDTIVQPSHPPHPNRYHASNGQP